MIHMYLFLVQYIDSFLSTSSYKSDIKGLVVIKSIRSTLNCINNSTNFFKQYYFRRVIWTSYCQKIPAFVEVNTVAKTINTYNIRNFQYEVIYFDEFFTRTDNRNSFNKPSNSSWTWIFWSSISAILICFFYRNTITRVIKCLICTLLQNTGGKTQ